MTEGHNDRLQQEVRRLTDSHDRLRAEVERLTRERDNWKAHAISRGKRLRRACDKFINIKDEIEDEGDRIYFGSSNHADEFREEVAWLDDFKWDKIMGEPEDWDLLGALDKQTKRAEAAERENGELRKTIMANAQDAERQVAMLREALRPFAEFYYGGESAPMRKWIDNARTALAEMEKKEPPK